MTNAGDEVLVTRQIHVSPLFQRGVGGIPAFILAAALACGAANAQPGAWRPGKNVEIVTTGGATEVTARLLHRLFRDHRLINQRSGVVVRDGEGGATAETYLNRHAGDGHYLALSTPTMVTNRITRSNPPTFADITPITNLFNEYILIAVRADSPIRNGKDLAARLERDGPPVSVGFSSALGNHIHIAASLVARAVGGDGRKMRVVLYETGTQAAAGVVSGEVELVSATAGALLPEMQAGKLRPLGLTAPRRLGGALAGVPTWKEQGYDVVFSSWRGVIGPRGMSAAQIAYWEEVFLKLSFTDEWLGELTKRSWDGIYLNGSETRKFLEEQYTLMKAVLTELGLAR